MLKLVRVWSGLEGGRYISAGVGSRAVDSQLVSELERQQREIRGRGRHVEQV